MFSKYYSGPFPLSASHSRCSEWLGRSRTSPWLEQSNSSECSVHRDGPSQSRSQSARRPQNEREKSRPCYHESGLRQRWGTAEGQWQAGSGSRRRGAGAAGDHDGGAGKQAWDQAKLLVSGDAGARAGGKGREERPRLASEERMSAARWRCPRDVRERGARQTAGIERRQETVFVRSRLGRRAVERAGTARGEGRRVAESVADLQRECWGRANPRNLCVGRSERIR
jgi:hypothetical protein